MAAFSFDDSGACVPLAVVRSTSAACDSERPVAVEIRFVCAEGANAVPDAGFLLAVSGNANVNEGRARNFGER